MGSTDPTKALYSNTMEKEIDLLESRSNQLDNYLKKRSIFWVVYLLGFIIYVSSFLLFILIRLDTWILFITMFIFVLILLVFIIFFPKMGYRSRVSFTLYKISKDLETGKLQEKLIKFLFEITKYQTEDEIKNKDVIFESNAISIEKFEYYLNEFSLKLNHAFRNKRLDKIDSIKVKQLANAIYNRQTNIISLAEDLNKTYELKEDFPSKIYSIKKIIETKVFRFIFIELFLLVILCLLYFTITQDVSILVLSFFTFSTAILQIVFKDGVN